MYGALGAMTCHKWKVSTMHRSCHWRVKDTKHTIL